MYQQQPIQPQPAGPPPRPGVPPWVWLAAIGGALILMVMVAAAVASRSTGQPAAAPTSARPASVKATKAKARHHVSATEVESVAETAASDDGGADVAPYVAALVTLGNRCTQKPIDILTTDVLAAQMSMQQTGDQETKLAVMQSMVKISSAASDAKSGHQDCEAIAKAIADGVGK